MAIRNGQKKGAHCHLPTITNAIPLRAVHARLHLQPSDKGLLALRQELPLSAGSRAVRVLNDSSINTCFRFLNHKGNRTEDKTTVRKEIN